MKNVKVVIHGYHSQYYAIPIKRGSNVCEKYGHKMWMFVSENRRKYFMWNSGVFSVLSAKKKN